MAEGVVFHHALGLTERVRGFAAALRDADHTVHTPDLYDGRTFDTVEQGLAFSETIGGPMAIVDRGRAAVESLSSLKQTRPRTGGTELAVDDWVAVLLRSRR
jgi:dienelactone hydrolase